MKCKSAPLAATFALLLFACGKSHRPTAQQELWKQFSGENALAHVAELVKFGPRPSGSSSLQASRGYIKQTLTNFGWHVDEQNFTAPTPRGSVKFTNLIAQFGPDAAKPKCLLLTHYDTKLFDTIRFVGANDGGSGTGAILELARVLALDPALAKQLELVFLDGEEAVNQFDETDGLYGSRHFARTLESSSQSRQFEWAILWDMIGDADLTITLPVDSPQRLTQGILESAEKLGTRRYFTFFHSSVLDDHVPLNDIGIPAIDLIDFDYSPWHTAGDTIDKLSADSLKKVADVTLFFFTGSLG